MKKRISACIIALLLCAAAIQVSAQEKTTTPAQRKLPRWVSDKGYWMVESNEREPRYSRIYFYNNDNILVHKETLEDVTLSLGRKHTKIKLTKVLNRVVDAWAAGHPCDSTQNFVAALFTY